MAKHKYVVEGIDPFSGEQGVMEVESEREYQVGDKVTLQHDVEPATVVKLGSMEEEQAYEQAQIDPNAIPDDTQEAPAISEKPVKLQPQASEQSPDRMERAKARWNAVAGALKRLDSDSKGTTSPASPLQQAVSQQPPRASPQEKLQGFGIAGPRADWFGTSGGGISLGSGMGAKMLLGGGSRSRRVPRYGRKSTRTTTASTNPLARALMASPRRAPRNALGRFRLGSTRKGTRRTGGFSLFSYNSSGSVSMPGWMRVKGRKGSKAKWTRL